MASETGNTSVSTQAPVHAGVNGGKGEKEVDIPLGLTVDKETGYIYICDYGEDRIQVYGEECEYVRTIRADGMACPTYVCVSSDHLFVSCATCNPPSCIYKLDKAAGGSLCRVETGYFMSCMCVDTDTLFVGMCDSNAISKFSVETLGSVGKIQLNSPHITEKTMLYNLKLASDLFIVLFLKCAYPVQSFSKDGALQRAIVAQEDLISPYYFCLASDMKIIIGDAGANNIKVFSKEGQLVGTIGQEGTGPGQFIDPLGIDTNENGQIIVVDQKVSNKLQTFDN